MQGFAISGSVWGFSAPYHACLSIEEVQFEVKYFSRPSDF